MDALEMRPTKANALAAGTPETVGGALIALGAATPLAASILIGTMLTAIEKVHRRNGVWVSQGGWECNAVLIASLVALTDAGPGRVSIDAALFDSEQWGAGWAFGALALGAVASAAAINLGKRGAASEKAVPASTSGLVQATEGDTAGDPVTIDAEG